MHFSPHLPPQLAPLCSVQSAQPHIVSLDEHPWDVVLWHEAQYSWGEFEVQGKEATCQGHHRCCQGD